MILKQNLGIQILMILHYRESENIVIKKTKDITEEEKQKHKAFFEGETVIFVIEKLTRGIIGRSKLPKATEVRKKLRYNHDDIMFRKETSIAEKIMKLFPQENFV